MLLGHHHQDLWISSVESQKLFQHQHWVYVLHYTTAFLVIPGDLQLYLKGISTGNNYFLKNKWKKVHEAEKTSSAAMQLSFSPWDPGHMSKCLKNNPFGGRQLGWQCTVLLGRKEWERRMKSRMLFLLPSCSWRIWSEKTCTLSDSSELIPAQEIIQPSHSCWMNHLPSLSALVAHPVIQPGPSATSLSSSSAWSVCTEKQGGVCDLS